MLVCNTRVPHWGPGKILAIEGRTATVYFRDFEEEKAGAALKRIDLALGFLKVLPSQSDALLDHLPPLVDGKLQITKPRLTLAQAIAAFTRRFPKGFNDSDYLGAKATGERTYKWGAHELWVKTLGSGQGSRLLSQGNLTDVVSRALAVEGRLNLLSVYERAALRDGLKDTEAAARYFATLFPLLDSREPSRQLFERHIEALSGLPAAEGRAPVTRWPILTLFPFVASPDPFGYQRDALPRAAAELFGFDRLPPGGAEIVGTVVDGLVERKILTVSGPYVYVA